MPYWNRVYRLCRLCLGLLIAMAIQPAGANETETQVNQCPATLNHEFQLLRKSEKENLCAYSGKVLLVVNTASRCGYTPQFKGLEHLYQTYRDEGFVVLGFPSDDFNQELETDESIARFCKINYGVTFPMFSKSPVTGDHANPLYRLLIQETGKQPRWNFNKYLVDRRGNVVEHFPSNIAPESEKLVNRIEALL